ncbi:hypothetical protein CCP3SC1AL1_40015 [Gammaproteobacteria bacterium]
MFVRFHRYLPFFAKHNEILLDYSKIAGLDNPHRKKMRKLAVILAIFVVPPAIVADEASNSEPGEPAFNAGRPGSTESPFAVPTGYFQIESGLLGYTLTSSEGVLSRSWNVMQTAFRYGIFKDTDIQLVVQPYLTQNQRGEGLTNTTQGFAGVTLRMAHTLSNGEDGGPAFGIIGFITPPLAKKELKESGLVSDRTEGGALETFSLGLIDQLTLTVTLGDAMRRRDDRYVNEYSGGVNLTYAFSDKVGAYVEGFAARASKEQTVGTYNFGATYLLDRVTQLDAGVNFGGSHEADDTNLFIGWSHRF